MKDSLDIITIKLSKSATGLFSATSEALDGVYMAHRDLTKIVADLPEVVKRWFKVHKNEDVTVFVSPLDGETTIGAIPVPAQIAAQALAR
jgi:hypothetical protein